MKANDIDKVTTLLAEYKRLRLLRTALKDRKRYRLVAYLEDTHGKIPGPPDFALHQTRVDGDLEKFRSGVMDQVVARIGQVRDDLRELGVTT